MKKNVMRRKKKAIELCFHDILKMPVATQECSEYALGLWMGGLATIVYWTHMALKIEQFKIKY